MVPNVVPINSSDGGHATQSQTCADDATHFAALTGERLTLQAFHQLAGNMAGYPFVKVVVERDSGRLHFLNNERYPFHADYIAERVKNITREELRADIDNFNHLVYLSPDRPYFLGILALHQRGAGAFFALETVEIDNMGATLLLEFFAALKSHIDPALPLYFKPANHLQEATVAGIDTTTLPRLLHHELYSSRDFVALNAGDTTGRLRIFTEETFERDVATIKWHDIVLMDRVPDDIPRVSGLINSLHTTPLSHTNVLACGWGIPNAVQVGLLDQAQRDGLDGKWVHYVVDQSASAVLIERRESPQTLPDRPAWSVQQIRLEEPETDATPIRALSELRLSDHRAYGTKASYLGELIHILDCGSPRLTGFYRVPRPPRANLLPYLAEYLKVPNDASLPNRAWRFLKAAIEVPRGIALPFALQQRFLSSSWQIQQSIGKLKMALELNAKEIDPLCLRLQKLIRSTRMSDELRDAIDEQIATHLAGVRTFVIRSSSNAEDLKDFSAAGIYESINHVTSADKIFESVKEVWASLVSPRSVRLRHEVGISLDDCYMGVVIQEEVSSDMGGVLVTTNPTNPQGDFRNVYMNALFGSAIDVVSGKGTPYQFLYNTVEGGGRTMAVGSSGRDVDAKQKDTLQRLAFAGRLLQSHFAQDYSFSTPADIEWASKGDKIFILQLRPYAV